MRLTRRDLLKGMVATAAGILLPENVAAEPERRIWALDRTMVIQPTLIDVEWNGYGWTAMSMQEGDPEWIKYSYRPVIRTKSGHEHIQPLNPNLYWKHISTEPDGAQLFHLFRR